MAVQPGLCRTWLETPKTVFLASRLIYIAKDYFPILTVTCLENIENEKAICNVMRLKAARAVKRTNVDSFIRVQGTLNLLSEVVLLSSNMCVSEQKKIYSQKEPHLYICIIYTCTTINFVCTGHPRMVGKPPYTVCMYMYVC